MQPRLQLIAKGIAQGRVRRHQAPRQVRHWQVVVAGQHQRVARGQAREELGSSGKFFGLGVLGDITRGDHRLRPVVQGQGQQRFKRGRIFSAEVHVRHMQKQ